MHLVLTGATGLVGSGVLDAMIRMKDITKISILSRGPVKMAENTKDPRINVIIHKDFEKYDPAVLSQLKGATGCVWALGISQTKVGKEEYIKITKTFTLDAAKAFQTLPPDNEPFNFVYVSGNGATTDPGRFSAIFARVKGETELALADMRQANPLLHTSSVRPTIISEANHDAIKPYVPPRPSYERILLAPLSAFRNLVPNLWSPTEQLGKFLAEMAMGRYEDQLVASKDIQMVGDMPLLENSAFRRLVRLN